jgi:hypothetical protein
MSPFVSIVNSVSSGFGQEMAKFFNREGAQKLDAPLDLLRSFSERAKFLAIGPSRSCRVRNTPVGNVWLARENGTRFPGPIADGDDDVECHVSVLVPRLAARAPCINLVLISQHLKRKRIDRSCRLTAGAISFESVVAGLLREVLGKDAPGRITRAKKENLLLCVCHSAILTIHICLGEYNA